MQVMPNLERARYVTRNYAGMQGLRWIPYGAAALASGVLGLAWPSAQWIASVAILIALGLYWLIGAYYRRTFGQVERERAVSRTGIAIVIVALLAGQLTAAAHVPLYVVAGALILLSGPVIVIGLWRSGGLRLRAYWVVLWALFAAAGLLMLLPLPALASFVGQTNTLGHIIAAASGLVMIVGGALDHWRLMHLLPPIAEDGHAGSL